MNNTKAIKSYPSFLIFFLILILVSTSANAQYFGRNKVQYRDMDFKVIETEHFTIHHYTEPDHAIMDVARMSERWYTRLSTVLNHQFIERKPIIFYNSSIDFQQTNIVGGFIGQGTQGLTEGHKNRLVMPFATFYASTDHILGHEMVHEFQYDFAQRLPGAGLQNMANMPLWYIEGMAEYLSVGRDDPHTAMYLRDALLQERLPSVSDLTRRMDLYFPYRYGQAFWAYVGGRWGDQVIRPMYVTALTRGMTVAFDSVLNTSIRDFSDQWRRDITNAYQPLLEGKTLPHNAGRMVLHPDRGSSRMNLSPALSPNGRQVAFVSERDIFSIEMFIADAQTGRNQRRLTSTVNDQHLDALQFISTGGAWSHDGRRMAVIVSTRGQMELRILDPRNGRTLEQIAFDGVDDITTPSWSPDGNQIVFSGMNEGFTDLYIYNRRTQQLQRLTNDRYADLHPVWSPDGENITFVTDRGEATDFSRLTYGDMRLAIYHVPTAEIRVLNIFQNGKHINPQYSPDGSSIYFISDHDGFIDVYRYTLNDQQVYRVTNIATGVSGITSMSPAITVAAQTGELMFSVFENTNYYVYGLSAEQAQGVLVEDRSPATAARYLPPQFSPQPQLVTTYMADAETGLPVDTTWGQDPYRPRLGLDFISQSGVGMAMDRFGAMMGGGIIAHFSDMLGDHQLGAGLIMQGQSLRDIGGQLQYLNLGSRFQYGFMGGRIPYMTGYAYQSTAQGEPFIGQFIQRIYLDRVAGLSQYPIDVNRRLELSGGYTRYGFDLREIQYFRDSTREIRLASPGNLHLVQVTPAFVGDNSFFGFTSPAKGWRYRFEAEPTFGSMQYISALADYRRYFFSNPFTLAFRGMHYGRYGRDEEHPQIPPLFIGYDNLVRGYNFNSFIPSIECPPGVADCPAFDRLVGSRIALINAEVRVPLFGVESYGLIPFRFLPLELVAFADGGAAWTGDESLLLEFDTDSQERVPVLSTGLAARANLFGIIVLQVYYAYPFHRPERGGHFGLVLGPGW